jgi:hypothetical protein
MINTPGRDLNGVPNQTAAMMSLIIGVLLVMAAAGDVCFALFIAAGSFFSLRERVAQILPEPFTTGPMRALPIVLLFGAMFYWLVRQIFQAWSLPGNRSARGCARAAVSRSPGPS